MTARRTFLTLALCSLALAVVPLAHADDEPATQKFVRTKQEKLTKLVKEGKPVDDVFKEVLDYKALAESALIDHWSDLKDPQREEFTGLLSQLVRNSYRKNIKKTLGYSIKYEGVSPATGGELVRSVASSETDKREEAMHIDYLVANKSDGLRIVDVVTEGSSMVSNYRSSFNRIMKKGGFDEVIKRMKKKASSGSDGAD